MKRLVVCLFLFGEISSSMGFFHHKPLPPPAQDKHANATATATKWIKQPLDHFNKEENNTFWKQRYITNHQFLKKDGPLFINIGGESELDTSRVLGGQIFDISRNLGAYLIATEHRFYGESQPKKDISTKNLKYLRIEQSMADLASLIRELKANKMFTKSPVVVFGGSYAGTLAVWSRMLYPDLIDAAVASSAPVNVKPGCYEYYEVVNDALAIEGTPKCLETVQKGIKNIEHLLKHPEGVKKVSELFRLTKPLNTSNVLDVKVFFQTIESKFGNIVQYSKFEKSTRSACKTLVGDSNGAAELKLAKFMTEYDGNSFDDSVEYETIIKQMKNVSYDSGRAFFYQRCSEIGKFPTTDSKKQPFGNYASFSYFAEHKCPDVFGKQFNAELIINSDKHINEKFGGNKPNVTKVVFINGSLDPWHRISVLSDLSDEAPAILIEGASHCQDMHAEEPTDPEGLKLARKRVASLVAKWVEETRR